MGRVTHLAGKIVRRVLGTDRYKILMVAIQSKIGIFQDMEFGVPSAAYQLKKVFKKHACLFKISVKYNLNKIFLIKKEI